jgi:predicted NAD-dependent protein-ADP-ribosyltransferase YbiA (DUF1768 family)
VKDQVMKAIIQAKFDRGRIEAEVLVATGKAILVEGTLWHDSYWGVDLEKPGRPGENRLGKLLMEQRALLQQGITPIPELPVYGWQVICDVNTPF